MLTLPSTATLIQEASESRTSSVLAAGAPEASGEAETPGETDAAGDAEADGEPDTSGEAEGESTVVGVAPAGLSEIFPTGVRSTGMSIVYNGAFTIFGGFAPALLTWLTARRGPWVFAPAWSVMLAAVIALIALPFVRVKPCSP